MCACYFGANLIFLNVYFFFYILKFTFTLFEDQNLYTSETCSSRFSIHWFNLKALNP